jgi:hypothetical protein
MKAYWTELDERELSDDAGLTALIGEVLALSRPTVLFLEHDDGQTLSIGLGASETVLSYVDVGGTSFHSVGEPGREGVLKFQCRDQLDDFLAEMAVPAALGLEAAKAFVARPEQPQNVAWEADW